MGWTLLPLMISLGFFTWGAIVYYHIERPPRNALQVQVVAKQWMWKLQHAEGKKEINELHVPLGQTVSLTMTSQDVIHSFFVPAFRVKQDVVPGKYTTEWFQPTRLGEYHLFCAEYCGTDHSQMIGRVVVMEPADYQRWLTTGEHGHSRSPWRDGAFSRDKGCSGCHEAQPIVHAPPLEGIYGKQVPLNSGEVVTADDQYIRDSILLPGKQISAGYDNMMPSFTGHISEERDHADHRLPKIDRQRRNLTSNERKHRNRVRRTRRQRSLRHRVKSRAVNYLSRDHSVRSWLLTTDHKRIGLLYLWTILLFFTIASVAAAMMRIELLTPQGDLVTSETYNKLFTIHGVLMVWFFLIPSIPAVLGNFVIPLMLGARDVAFPQAESDELVYLYFRRGPGALVADPWRRGYGLDLLHALQHDLRELPCHLDGSRNLHRWVFLHSSPG